MEKEGSHVYSLQFEFGCDFGGVNKGNDGNSPSLFSTQKHSAQVHSMSWAMVYSKT